MARSTSRRRYEVVRRRVALGWSLFLTAIALAAGVLQVFEDSPWLCGLAWLPITATILLVVATAVDSGRRVVRKFLQPDSRKRHEEQLLLLMTTVVTVSREAGIPVQDLGVSLFEPRKDWWSPRSEPYLDRRERFRMAGAQASDVDWTKGKGVIGKCWQDAELVHRHWSPTAQRYGGQPLTPSRWRSVPDRDRWGFGEADFRIMINKYAEVLAVPITHPRTGELQGILSIDLSSHSACATGTPTLDTAGVEEAMTFAARLLADASRPS